MRLNSPYCTGTPENPHGRTLMNVHHPHPHAYLAYRCVACKQVKPIATADWTDDLPLYGDYLARVGYDTLGQHRQWSGPVRIRFTEVPGSNPPEVRIDAQTLPNPILLAQAVEMLLELDDDTTAEKGEAIRNHARSLLNQWRGDGDDPASGGWSATTSPSTVKV